MEVYNWIAIHEQALLIAIRDQDVVALDSLLHPDLLFTLPNGHIITKQDDLAAYRAGYMQVEHIESREQQIKVLGKAAVVAVAIELRGFYRNQPLDGIYRYLRVWQEQQTGRWQVIAGSSILLPS